MTSKLYIGGIITMQSGDINHLSDNIFFSGCDLRCSFCFNKTLWEQENGKEYTVSEVLDELSDVKWVCLIGGEPTVQDSKLLSELIDGIHAAGKKIIMFTHTTSPWDLYDADYYHIDIKPETGDIKEAPPGVKVSYGVVACPWLDPKGYNFNNVGRHIIYVKALDGIEMETAARWNEEIGKMGLNSIIRDKINVDEQ